MPVRPADPERDEDVTLVADWLRTTVNPPNETDESIREKMERERFFFVHPEEGTICWLREFTQVDPWNCQIVYWGWNGVGDRRRMAAVLKEALEAFVSGNGPTSLTWAIWGDLPTRAEADALKLMFGSLGATVTVRRSPRNETALTEARSTVGAILTALRAV